MAVHLHVSLSLCLDSRRISSYYMLSWYRISWDKNNLQNKFQPQKHPGGPGLSDGIISYGGDNCNSLLINVDVDWVVQAYTHVLCITYLLMRHLIFCLRASVAGLPQAESSWPTSGKSYKSCASQDIAVIRSLCKAVVEHETQAAIPF